MKLQSFHAALGEDSNLFTGRGNRIFGLFDQDRRRKDEKLAYLMMIRELKENSESFKQIKNMPLRARVGRDNRD